MAWSRPRALVTCHRSAGQADNRVFEATLDPNPFDLLQHSEIFAIFQHRGVHLCHLINAISIEVPMDAWLSKELDAEAQVDRMTLVKVPRHIRCKLRGCRQVSSGFDRDMM